MSINANSCHNNRERTAPGGRPPGSDFRAATLDAPSLWASISYAEK